MFANPTRSIGLYALAFVAMAPAVLSQTITTGEITGVVMDPAGRTINDAAVQLKSIDTGESRTVKSNVSGMYRFVFVKPGSYEISCKSEGLTSDTGRLVVAVGQVQLLDLHLKLEEPRSVVLVRDGAPLLNVDNADLIYTLSSQQLDLLPLPGGDLAGVAYSAPGVVISNRYGSGNFSLNGVGSVSNLFTVNGMDDMEPSLNVNNSGVTGLLLGANEVQEASVIQNAFEGQYGRQAGAQVNYVTKSGTNAFHGNMVYDYNGTILNANDFFANSTGTSRAPAISNQYAASFGGPAIKNKLFFFTDTEGLRFLLPAANHVAVVPSPALEAYTLRTIQQSQVPFYQKMFDLYSRAPGRERVVPVTTGLSPLQDQTGKRGCGTLAGTPTGTGEIFGTDVSCTLAWDTNASALTSEWLFSTRVDYNLSANQRTFFRFKTDHGYLPVSPSDVSPVFNVVSQQPDYEGQLNHTITLSPRLVNNLILSVNYNDYVFGLSDVGAAIQIFPVQVAVRNDGGANGNFIAPVGPPAMYPKGRRAGQFQAVDDISYSAGKHSFMAGVNYRYTRESDLGYASFVGLGKFTLFQMDDFAKGVLTGKTNSVFFQNFTNNPVFHLRFHHFGTYVQDQWALTPDLKITATLRFDRASNPYCVNRCFAALITPFADLNKGVSVPYNASIQTGLSHAFYGVEPVVAQPRFTIAYSPSWSRKTVFRGGIGLFSDLYPGFFASFFGGNPPNQFAPSIRTGLINAGGSGSAPAIAAASANAFESEFAAGATLGELQQAVAPAPFGPPQYYSIPKTVLNPKSLQWSGEIQRQFGMNNVLLIRYMGNHDYDVFMTNANANSNADPASYPNGFASLPAATPDPRFSIVRQVANSGYTNYNAVMVSFRRAFSHGFQGQISYVWSHALDTVSNGGLAGFSYDSIGGQIDPTNLRSLNYSNADYDVRHNLTGDFIWEMPLKLSNGLMDSIFGRWSIGTKLSAHTGTPFSVTNSAPHPSASFGGTVLADVWDPNAEGVCGHSAINTPCFTPSQFAPAKTQADFGNLPRNSFRGPGYFDIDSSLLKTVVKRERMVLVLGATAYNVLNHPNFADPNSDLASAGLGLIIRTGINPSGPYGHYGGPSGRTVVVMGRLAF